MPIVPLYGHLSLRGRLARSATTGSLSSSLLLHGPRGVGKQRLALWLAQTLLCEKPSEKDVCGACQGCRYTQELTHPDLYWVFPRPRLKDSDPDAAEVKQDYAEAISERVKNGLLYPPPSGTEAIYVATARWLVQVASRTPAMAHRKVIVVGDAERMVPQAGADAAANAFLKLLEEPPADTTIILTSSEPGALLPTIRSRVVAVRVAPVNEKEMRAFLKDPLVVDALKVANVPPGDDERVRLAHGAPGVLLADRSASNAVTAAKAIFDAAKTAGADRYKIALQQGVSGARGAFTDALTELTLLVHGRAEEAARRGNVAGARSAYTMLAAVEEAKALAENNINPQLVTASLMRTMGVGSGAGADNSAGLGNW